MQGAIHRCEKCGRGYRHRENLLHAVLPWFSFDDDGNGQHRCKVCGRGYRWRESLLRHMRVECGKEAQFQCPFCPLKTKHKHSLVRHVRKHLSSNLPAQM
ncbi:hypothetical protein L9F63_012165 [Diploptera punctata]|uniref:C2H2-type domain-containing protein n=1 Tax=Diploptera punctata TaxID=6984 RepID=A0AAD8ACY6_DIPPU|nr:hypothetical protein L9F63_012165 [Diploptera punctata]